MQILGGLQGGGVWNSSEVAKLTLTVPEAAANGHARIRPRTLQLLRPRLTLPR